MGFWGIRLMRKHIKNCISILAGGALIAIGIQLFLAPNQLIFGGISGISIIINSFTGWPIGVLIFAINLPIFLFALRQLGALFLLTAFAGVAVTSVWVEVFALLELVPTQDRLLAAIFAGLSIGIGVSLLFAAGSAGSGLDILARLILMKRPHLTLGWVILLMDMSIVIVGAFIFRQIEVALYAAISIFMLKQSIDSVLPKVKSGEVT